MKTFRSICFVQNHYYKCTIGGAEVQAYLLAREFVNSGWEVSYLTGDINESEEDHGIILHPFSQNGLSKYSHSDISVALSKIDASVYYQRGRGECTYFLSRFCREADKPFISALSMDIDCRKYKNLPRVFEKGFRNR